jgi:hypothetical protein
MVYTLTNAGLSSLNWAVDHTAAWLDVVPTNGTLAAGASLGVTVSLNALANGLPGGTHSDTLVFSNQTSGAVQTRGVTLTIESVASIPFAETFEGGSPLADYWKITGTAEYRMQVTTANTPHGGSYHLTMDDSVDGSAYSRNELTLTIDLAGYENVVLTFWAKEFNDEPHGPPPSPFTGGADFDGVAISADGNTWYEVLGLRTLSSTYQQQTVDLDAAAAAHGLTYNSRFRIRFNHYDDYGIPTDGFAFDDIQIAGVVADDLSVAPTDGLTSDGYQGGPFSPSNKVYTLTNAGTSNLTWTAGCASNWVSVAPSAGTLAAGGSTGVTVSINANANALVPGSYADAVVFSNLVSGVSQTRDVSLNIAAIPGEIQVLDSIAPSNDLAMPFGPVIVGLSRTEHITVRNTNALHDLIISDIALRGRLLMSVPSEGLARALAGGPVSVTLPAVGAVPAMEDVYASQGGEARAASVLEVPAGYPVALSGLDVLLLASGFGVTRLQTGLEAFADINRVDSFDCSLAVPTAGLLAGYDVVVVMSNTGFLDALQTGNVLADYVDGDGKVVQAVATFATGGGWQLAGRFAVEQYGPFVHGPAEFLTHTLGSYDAGHPIMAGVTALSDGLPVGVSLQPGVEWVADWNNGTPLVAVAESGVVGVNIFAFDSGDYTGDVVLLFHNAVVYSSASGFELQGLPSLPYTVPPLGGVTFDVIYAPQAVGSNTAAVVIESNDADEPEVRVALSGEGILDYLAVTPVTGFEPAGIRAGRSVRATRRISSATTAPCPSSGRRAIRRRG